MNGKKLLVLCILLILVLVTLNGCVPGDGSNMETKPAGFIAGVWHGWIAPFSLIYSVFNQDIGIYEIHNNGFWYDLGYYMAIVSGFGGLTLFRKRKRSTHSTDGNE